MRITDIKPYLTMPNEGLAWLFVEVETDEGITGKPLRSRRRAGTRRR